MDRSGICSATDDAIKRIHFTNQVSFTQATYGRIAAHRAHGLPIEGHQSHACTHAGGNRRRLDACMSAADYDDIKLLHMSLQIRQLSQRVKALFHVEPVNHHTTHRVSRETSELFSDTETTKQCIQHVFRCRPPGQSIKRHTDRTQLFSHYQRISLNIDAAQCLIGILKYSMLTGIESPLARLGKTGSGMFNQLTFQLTNTEAVAGRHPQSGRSLCRMTCIGLALNLPGIIRPLPFRAKPEHQIGITHCCLCPPDSFALNRVVTTIMQACGVDKGERYSINRDRALDNVTRCTCYRRDNCCFIFQQNIE